MKSYDKVQNSDTGELNWQRFVCMNNLQLQCNYNTDNERSLKAFVITRVKINKPEELLIPATL